MACSGACSQCPNECRCRNGIPVDGTWCKKDGAYECEKCDGGYKLVGDKCVEKPPPVDQTNSKNVGDIHMSSCVTNCGVSNDGDQSNGYKYQADYRDYSVTCEMYNSNTRHCRHSETNERVFDVDYSLVNAEAEASAENKACHQALINFEQTGQSNSCVTTAGSYKMATGALVMSLGLAIGLSI